MALVAELGVPTQPVSLDEVYLDLSALPDPIARMSGARAARSASGCSLDASVGIGPNRLVAKVASDAEKPRGFVVLTREQAARRFAPEPPRLLPGIGPKTAERLEALGVRTIGDLQAYPGRRARAPLRPAATAAGCTSARTSATTRRSPAGEAKSRSVETTFDYDIADLARARAGARRAVAAARRAARASARSAAARSGSRSASTTGPPSPACTRSTRRPTTRR